MKNLAHILDKEQKPIRAIYISSYIPRKCGIATFTKDLTDPINQQNPDALAEIVVMNDGVNKDTVYPWEAKFKINRDEPSDYVNAANYINQSSTDIVNLQHEFGLYGGVDGEYILTLVDMLTKPLVTCFHSILPEPDSHKLYIMKRIIEKSSAVIAMSQSSLNLLVDLYGCAPEKAVLIHHGVPNFGYAPTDKYKKELKIKADYMLMASGLLSPGKGFEYIIEAMPAIKKVNKNAKLYIIGASHPGVIKNGVDVYRDKLKSLADKLKVSKNVVFVDKFLGLNELTRYFMAADFYITPHLDPQQPTSGTLAKALGAGKVCISTPYYYADEMLGDGTGILVDFNDSVTIADAVIKVIGDKALYEKYRRAAFKKGKFMQWPRIAARYLELFRTVIEE
jgi:glycosyltransferase involved in cell wall biosynthesis